jgi:hypothetical protein
MTPFEQFRVWLRRASTSERATSAVVGTLVLGLVVFIALPVTTNHGDAANGGAVVAGETSASPNGQQSDWGSTPAAGPNGSSSSSASGPTTESSGATGKTGGGNVAIAGGTAAAGCTSPPGSDQGISTSEIHIAVTLIEIYGPTANSAFGVPSAAEQQKDYEIAIDDLNKHGGVACRKLVPKFYVVNDADENDQKSKCLDILGTKVFAVLDAGGYYGTAAANCFPQQQLPFFGTGRLAPEQIDQFYPYMFGTGDYYSLYRNGVLGFNQAGLFGKDLTFKLGWVYRDCWGSLVSEVRQLLHQVGLQDSQIVDYDLGCPTGGFATPADLQQAILKFQTANATTVLESQAYDDFANFTNVAQGQGFKPKYGMLDEEMIPTTQGNVHVNYDNVDGALIVNADRYGDESGGVAPNAATQRCDAISTAAGKPPTYKQLVGFAGVVCGQIWMFAAAAEHAPSLQRKSLADGLHAAKSIDMPYPRGPVDWSGAKTTYGGQFWRLQTFQKGCTCWKVTDATFRPGFR